MSSKSKAASQADTTDKTDQAIAKSKLLQSAALSYLPVMGCVLYYIYLICMMQLQISPDSSTYYLQAQMFAQDLSVSGFSPKWPPLLPILLAGLSALTGGWPDLAGKIVNIGSLIAILWLVDRIAAQFRLSAFWRGMALAYLAATMLIARPFYYLWTEPVYTAISLLWIYGLLRHWASNSVLWLGVAILSAAAMALSRYIGYVAYAGTLAYIAILFVPASFRQRVGFGRGDLDKSLSRWLLILAAASAVIAALPSIFWLLHTIEVSGCAHACRVPTDLGWLDNMKRMGAYLSQSHGLLVLGFLGIASLLVARILRGQRAQLRFVAMEGGLILGYALCYAVLLIHATSSVRMDPINDRLMYPMMPFLVLGVLWLASIAQPAMDGWLRKSAIMLPLMLLVAYCTLTSMGLGWERNVAKDKPYIAAVTAALKPEMRDNGLSDINIGLGMDQPVIRSQIMRAILLGAIFRNGMGCDYQAMQAGRAILSCPIEGQDYRLSIGTDTPMDESSPGVGDNYARLRAEFIFRDWEGLANEKIETPGHDMKQDLSAGPYRLIILQKHAP